MSETYRLNGTDKNVVEAVKLQLSRLVSSGEINTAQLASIAKVQRVLLQLPSVTEGVYVTVGIAHRVRNAESGEMSYFQFVVAGEMLELTCGGSVYTKEFGSDSFTTMEWSITPGERSEYDNSWDDKWVGDELDRYEGRAPNHFNLRECVISVDGDGNRLLTDE